ncbi:hypothetical protein L0F63_005773 [Massospora cicadina]|nr:hypothetical protein L0F63_005773 [Massospora cicadina]
MDVDLYCSETCRKRDELPSLELAAVECTAASSPTGSLTPSPSLTYHRLPELSPSRVSPSDISLGKPMQAMSLCARHPLYQPSSL